MKNILTEALVNSATNASFIFSYTNSAKLRNYTKKNGKGISNYIRLTIICEINHILVYYIRYKEICSQH